MLTDKCKTDFEKWLENHIIFCTVDDLLYWFYEQPSMMQYGIYVDFFDEKGLHIDIDVVFKGDDFNELLFDGCLKDNELFILELFKGNTRQEAREQAIIKSNEIYNSKQ